MKEIFLALQTYLLGRLASTDPLMNVTYIRLWNNQVQYAKDAIDETYPYPAIFIDFPEEIEWKQIGNGVQTVDPLMIRLHIVHDFYDAQDGTMGQDLAILELAQKVYTSLQEWMPNIPLGVFVRVMEVQDKDHPNLYHFIQTYQTTWIDTAMKRPVNGSVTTEPLDLQLDINPGVGTGTIEIDLDVV